ncbi:hypothetical protein SISSUDRAFT_1025893 [Sistotremastrum suecicum HHB10207 ss-3]|uniref:Uncharacterized protein n=1 Tax=Sistotremastrum suecicum HHB10207 ss-3 TaxID=1314776 RepID=A0A166A690_9AGAM|nr:hypothetical protein SISSUDRAFT_1025893 [Sistotremastrum suecicum HHB10207 ss-3]
MQGLLTMLTKFIQAGHVQADVLEGKTARLVRAMEALIPKATILTQARSIREASAASQGAVSNEPIDVDKLDEHALPVRDSASNSAKGKAPARTRRIYLECPGLRILFGPGQNPYTTYAWAMHVHHETPWDPMMIRDEMFVRSWNCNDIVPDNHEACIPCEALVRNNVLRNMLKRMKEGIHENSPHHYQPIAGLLGIIHIKSARINVLRLLKLNDNRALLHRQRQIEDSKRFVLAVASGKVTRISALVRTAVKRGSSVRAMVVSMEKAAVDLY